MPFLSNMSLSIYLLREDDDPRLEDPRLLPMLDLLPELLDTPLLLLEEDLDGEYDLDVLDLDVLTPLEFLVLLLLVFTLLLVLLVLGE